MAGYVYLIGSPTFGWYKIGKSITPEVRVANIGVLLPFKIEVLAVWKAANHHLMESTLHEIYSDKRINGEWFEFTKKQVCELIEAIPAETRIFPTESNLQTAFASFSNITIDTKTTHKVVGVKIQRLRGNFTPEEREAKKLASIEQQRIKKLERKKLLENRE